MANPSPFPLPEKSQARSVDSAREPQPETSQSQTSSDGISGTFIASGPRKLIRPVMPQRVLAANSSSRRNSSPLLAHHESMMGLQSGVESSHAEAFYFQKQAHAQTPMVIVLESGERIEGCIEWYDRNAIKVKNHHRTLIYKSSIKYIYKAGENEER